MPLRWKMFHSLNTGSTFPVVHNRRTTLADKSTLMVLFVEARGKLPKKVANHFLSLTHPGKGSRGVTVSKR